MKEQAKKKPIVLTSSFSVEAYPDCWMIARQGDKKFFIGKKGRGHRLFPYLGKNGKSSVIRTDKAIYIPEA